MGKNKSALSAIALIAIACANANAMMTVHDPALQAQSAVQEVSNYLQYLHTQVNTLDSYANQVQQLSRMGNPASLVSNIPGMSAVRDLMGTVREVAADYYTIKSLVSPNQSQNQALSILAAYHLPGFSGSTSGLGVQTSLSPSLYGTQTSQWQILATAQSTLSMIEQKRQMLIQQSADLTQAMQSATTQSEVQKYNAALTAVNNTLAALQATESQYEARVQMLQSQLNTANGIYRQNTADQNSSIFQQSLESTQIPGMFRGIATTFGAIDNPATGGSGDPAAVAAGGNWYTGAWGANIGSPNAFYVSLPSSTEAYLYGSSDNARGHLVEVIDTATGMATTAPIGDKGGPANGIDVTSGVAKALGMSPNGGDYVVYKPL